MRAKFGLLLVCLEAVIFLTVCKLTILFIAFDRYARRLGISHCETLRDDMSANLPSLRAIRFALRKVPRCLPWKSQCLDQAMAAQRMLARRGLPTTFYLGVDKKTAGSLMAHAWLRCGQWPVVGYQAQMTYAVVATYAWLA